MPIGENVKSETGKLMMYLGSAYSMHPKLAYRRNDLGARNSPDK